MNSLYSPILAFLGMLTAGGIAYGTVTSEINSLREETSDLKTIRRDMAVLQAEIRSLSLSIVDLKQQIDKIPSFQYDYYKESREILILQRQLMEKLYDLEREKKK